VGTANLVSDQADYEISSADFLNLIRVEVKDSAGNWSFLNPISYEDKKGVAMTEWAKTNGTPTVYDKVGNSIVLYPTPNYNSTLGLRVYFQRKASYFIPTDTTKEPGFAPIFHRILSMGAARDYCLLNALDNKMITLDSEIAKMEEQLVDYYSQRSRDEQPRMTLAREDFTVGDNAGEQSVSWSG